MRLVLDLLSEECAPLADRTACRQFARGDFVGSNSRIRRAQASAWVRFLCGSTSLDYACDPDLVLHLVSASCVSLAPARNPSDRPATPAIVAQESSEGRPA